MRVMLLERPRPVTKLPLTAAHREVREPGAEELRVRVRACGVCHTDLHLATGDLEIHRCPVIPGHQIVGVVEAVGDGVSPARIGERVGITWLSSTCGSCRFCLDQRENLCPHALFTGYDIDGGFAETCVAPASAAHLLPEVISDVDAAPLLCAGVIGYRSLCLSEVGCGERLGLYGFGASAHLAIQVARHWDCEVYVCTRSENHRRVAERLGAVWTGSADQVPPVLLDAAITFAPAGWIIGRALEALRPGGTLAVNAIHMDEVPPLDYHRHLYGERTLRSVTNLTARDAREFLDLAAAIGVRAHVTAFPLEEVNVALQKLAISELEAAAVLTME